MNEAEANARLFAASLDLLELIKVGAVPGGIGFNDFIRPGGWQERALAAIAKATGSKG